MAQDNAAQAIKDLQKNLKDLDTQLVRSQEGIAKIGELIQQAMTKAGTSVDDFIKQFRGKIGAVEGEKLRLAVEFVGKNGKKIDNAVKALEGAIDKRAKQINIFGESIKGAEAIKQKYQELLEMQKKMKEPAKFYDQIFSIVNKIGGTKENRGTALGEARANEMKKVALYTKEANEELDRQNRLEKAIKKVTDRGGRGMKFDGEYMSLKRLNEELEQSRQRQEKYYRTLQGFGSRGAQAARAFGGEGYATALKKQEANFMRLNFLLNERRKLEAQIKAQGGQGSDAQVRYQRILKNAIEQTVQSMRELGKQYQGVTREASQNTMEQRARRTQRTIDSLNSSLGKTKNILSNMLPTVQRLASAFGVAFSIRGLAQFGKKLIETRGEFEMQQVALRSILQNKQLADEIYDKTMKAALQSPFTAMQLTKYTKQLAAYRIETEKLFDTTKRLADVSAGLGVDMQRLILAYGQVKAANYLRASEIRQFTEAGVNILGELRDYFNEVKGMSVNTAEVMEMVTKRLVGFQDVEAIFKRMTDQGGIFYNMQYVQSQTVKGQINKLHDAYQQMLNTIGKQNQSTLKAFVATLNNIVANWRSWAVAIKSIGFGALIGYLSKTVVALGKFNVAGIAASRSVRKLAVNMQMFSKWLAGNWVTLAIAGVSALVTTFVNLDKKMKETNREIDEQNLRLYQTRKSFEDLKKKIEENNNIISDSKSDQEALNKAQDDNKRIMKKLGDEYPQMASQMKVATNGIIDMNDAIDINIRKLNEQMIAINAMKQENWFVDSDRKTLDKAEQAVSSMYVKMASVISTAEQKMVDLEMEMGQEEAKATTLYNIYKQITEIDIDGNIVLAVREFEKLNEEANKYSDTIQKELKDAGLNKFFKKKTFEATSRDHVNPLFEALGVSNIFGGLKEDLKQTQQLGMAQKVIEKHSAAMRRAYEKGIRDNKEYNEKINKEYSGDFLAFVNANAKILNEAAKNGINKANETLIKVLNPQTANMRRIFNDMLNSMWGTHGVDYFATVDTTNDNKQIEPKPDKTKESAARLLSLIKEMRSEYDKLSKSAYGFSKSQDKVRKSYEESVKEILGAAGVSTDYDFTTNQGMIAALEKVKSYVQNNAKFAKDAWKEVQKDIDQLQATIEIDAQVRIREDFGRQMEEALGDYEITLELDKLNLPKGLANDLWGVQKTDLSDLRAQLSDMYLGLQDENGQLSEDAFKDYEKYLNKIDDLERKQQRERLKDYSKYLEAQYSERVKLEMDYVRKLAGLEATSMSEEQKKDVREGLRKEFLEKSRKQDFEDFKGSEFYVQMMEDLGKQGSASLDVMKKKLLEMRDNAENLSPRALKEVVRALEKIDDIERSRNKPLSRLIDASSELNKKMSELDDKNMKGVYSALAANQEQLATYEEQEKELERMIMLENERLRLEEQGVTLEHARTMYGMSQEGLNKAQENLKKYKSSGTKEDQLLLSQLEEEVNKAAMQTEMWRLAIEALAGKAVVGEQKEGGTYATMSLPQLKKRRDELKQQKKELQGQIDKEEELVRLDKELQLAWSATWESIKDWGNRIQNLFDGVMDHVEYFTEDTYGMIGAWKEFGDTSVSAMNDLVSGIQAYQAANEEAKKGKLATGLLTANGLKLALVVLGVIIKVVQAISKIKDARIDKEIEIQQEKIDNLQRAYERLEKQIEKTWYSVSYMGIYNKELQNTYEQISALNEQINLENSKKKVDNDKIQGYEDAIRDAEDQLEELKQKQIEVFGGIGKEGYRDAAQGFVDAWKSAFLETGDGLQGLQDHFDEFLQDWFVKQATMRIAGRMLEPLFQEIDEAVDQYSGNGANVMLEELKKVREKFGMIAPELSSALEELAGLWGINGEGGLSGLAAGIQGITEEQANVLEAYWNSVRGYTASIDMNVSRIVDLLSNGGGRDYNPQLTYLDGIAKSTNALYNLFDGTVVGGHPNGGKGVKVFIN